MEITPPVRDNEMRSAKKLQSCLSFNKNNGKWITLEIHMA
jgi:hypothetical protein